MGYIRRWAGQSVNSEGEHTLGVGLPVMSGFCLFNGLVRRACESSMAQDKIKTVRPWTLSVRDEEGERE